MFRFTLVLASFLFSGAQSASNETIRRRRRSGGTPASPALLKRMDALEKNIASTRAELQGILELARKQKPEVKACWGKTIRDPCMFEAVDGGNKTGFCIGTGPLWCKAEPIASPPLLKRVDALEKNIASMRADVQRILEFARKQKPEVRACWGKKISEPCMFEAADGGNKTGFCIGRGPLWCKAAPIGGPDPPMPKPEEKACVGKKATDSCWFKAADGANKTGRCVGEIPLWCKTVPIGGPDNPDPPMPKPEERACLGKNATDSCWFKAADGANKTGICVGSSPLWCKTGPIGGPDPPKPKPEVKACMGKKAKEPCLFETLDGSKKTGFCIGEESLWCKARPIGNPEPPKLEKECLGRKYLDPCGMGVPALKGICYATGPHRETCNYQGAISKCWCKTAAIGGPNATAIACKGRLENEGCWYKSRIGTDPRGVCIGGTCNTREGKKEVKSCVGKRYNEKCSFGSENWYGSEFVGVCVGKDILSCKVAGGTPGGRPGKGGKGR